MGAALIASVMGDSTSAKVTGAPVSDTAGCVSAEGTGARLAGGGLDTFVGAGLDCNTIVGALCPVAWMNKPIPTAVDATTPQMARLKRTFGPNRRLPSVAGGG